MNKTREQRYKDLIFNSITELRKRVIICLLVFCVVFGFIFSKGNSFINYILHFTLKNLGEVELFTQNISSGLFFRLKISFYLSFAICLPIFLYNLYRFVSLGLFRKEKKVLLYISTLGVFLGYCGFCLSSLYLLPLCIEFFKSMQLDTAFVKQFVELNSFFSLCFNIGLCGFIAFQTPIIIFFLLRYDFLRVNKFWDFRRVYVPLYLIIGGIITPPDVLSQVCCALVMILLTELGLIAFVIYKFISKKNRLKNAQKRVYKFDNAINNKYNKICRSYISTNNDIKNNTEDKIHS